MQAIITKYHGPTDHKPSRISAQTGDGRQRIFTTVDTDLDEEAQHHKAAQALCRKLGWYWSGKLIGGAVRQGYAFVFAS